MDDKSSRETRFSTALWKLSEDWKEQADPPPSRPRPGRFLLFAFIVMLLYGLSAGPVGCILKMNGPPSAGIVRIYRGVYYPLVFLIDQHTPLEGLILDYLQFWGAR